MFTFKFSLYKFVSKNIGDDEADTDGLGQHESGQYKTGEIGERPISQARVRMKLLHLFFSTWDPQY